MCATGTDFSLLGQVQQQKNERNKEHNKNGHLAPTKERKVNVSRRKLLRYTKKKKIEKKLNFCRLPLTTLQCFTLHQRRKVAFFPFVAANLTRPDPGGRCELSWNGVLLGNVACRHVFFSVGTDWIASAGYTWFADVQMIQIMQAEDLQLESGLFIVLLSFKCQRVEFQNHANERSNFRVSLLPGKHGIYWEFYFTWKKIEFSRNFKLLIKLVLKHRVE